MKKVVLTGASGFIGKALCKRLLEEGYFVYSIVRNKESMNDISSFNLNIIELNMNEYENIYKYIPKNIDCFFHLSWDGVSGKNFKDVGVQFENVKNSIKILKNLIFMNVKKFIFFTTSHISRVYKHDKNIVSCIYGVNKYAFQNISKTFCYNNNIFYNSIMFTNVFGVGDYSNRSTNTIIKTMLSNEDVNLIEYDILYDWIYIDDAIDGIISVLESAKNMEDYYVGNRVRKFGNIIDDVKSIIGSNSNLYFGKFMEDSYINYDKLDINKLYRDTDFFSKSDFKRSIMKTMKFVKNMTSGGGEFI